MATTADLATPEQAQLFHDSTAWADMTTWHARAGELRRRSPVVRCEPEGFAPFLAVLGHPEVFAISRDHTTWNNTPKSVIMPEAEFQQLVDSGMPLPSTLVHLDGEAHRDTRKVTNDWFKPASVRTRQPRIDELADEFMQRMRDLGGSCDFATDIAQRYTLRVIMDIYGVPAEDEPLMMELTQGIFGAADPEFLGDAQDPQAKVLESVMNFIAYFGELTENRRTCPADDIASVIANGTIDGEYLSDEARLWYYIIIATAGHDTTSYALAGGMQAMLDGNVDQLWSLRGDADAVTNAAEECIRWTAPVRSFLRYAQTDTEVAGVPVAAGERVLLSYPAANRDERVFADPDRFDVDRGDAAQLISFGVGAHFCLGAQFARRELRTMLARLAEQLDHIELAGTPTWAESPFVSGVKHLPVEYRFA